MKPTRTQVGPCSLPWVAAGLVLLAAFARFTTVASAGLPGWFTDPWIDRSREATLTPMGSLLLDAMVWLGAVAAVFGERRRGRPVRMLAPGAILLGAIVIALHGFVLHSPEATGTDGSYGVRGHFGSLLLGSAWCSAMLGAWALSLVSRDHAIKRALVSIVLGAAALMAVKAALNTTIEHKGLVDHFAADPAAFLERQGIEPGSRAAEVFERRLRQTEATGWVSLSNAFGTVAGALALGLVAILAGVTRSGRGSRPGRAALAIASVVLAAVATLALTRSKGAIASTAGAGAILAAITVLRGRVPRRVLITGAVICTLAPLAAISARGLIGESLAERSLLFRWQYLVGASRVIADHPWFGAGPDGFKASYLLVRPPDAPEEVSSPHSVLFDWAAALGIAGVAWAGVWFAWLGRAVRVVLDDSDEPPTVDLHDEFRADVLTLAVCGGAGALSLWAEWASLSEPVAGAHLVGFLLWIIAARAVRRGLVSVGRRWTDTAALGAAMVVALHAHMEVTPTIDGTAALALGMLGLAATASLGQPKRVGGAVPLVSALGVGAIGSAVYALGPVRGWQSQLARSADEVALPGGGRPEVALARLDRAAARIPTDSGADEAAIRFQVVRAGGGTAAGGPGALEDDLLTGPDGALPRALRLSEDWPGSAGAWALRARVEEFVGRGSERPDLVDEAASSWDQVIALNPSGVAPLFERWRLAIATGDALAAQELADRLREADARMRAMDPLAGLSGPMRAAFDRWEARNGQ